MKNNPLIEKICSLGGQSFTAQSLYNTMHNSHTGYRHRNQGIAMSCDWLHLLKDKRGEVYSPWSNGSISVIEIGCGNGKLCTSLAGLGFDVTGADIFNNEIVYDRVGYKFKQHDLTKHPYPFADKEFDYCVSFDVLEHFPTKDIDATLKEMARICKSGIILAVSCTGAAPLHLTVESPGWWLDKLIENCPDYSWQLLRNFERIKKDKNPSGKNVSHFSDVRPVAEGYMVTHAPLFYGKRGAIADED